MIDLDKSCGAGVCPFRKPTEPARGAFFDACRCAPIFPGLIARLRAAEAVIAAYEDNEATMSHHWTCSLPPYGEGSTCTCGVYAFHEAIEAWRVARDPCLAQIHEDGAKKTCVAGAQGHAGDHEYPPTKETAP